MHKRRWLLIRDYIFAWTGALVLFSLVRTVGTIEADGFQVPARQGVILAPLFGILFGTFFAFVQMGFERLYNRRAALPKLFLFRLIFSFILLFFISVLAYGLFIIVLQVGVMTPKEFFQNPPILVFYLYVIIVDTIIAIFRQIGLMLGAENLKKLVKGQFYNPREEERIFMFLDLKSSTAMAEELGHFKYSRLLQDCFDDLAVVRKNDAEIYQYVGDEAVLTWPKKRGLRDFNCIHAFFHFKAQLEARSRHYKAEYGRMPVFKAGMNIGQVTVAEVGKFKKEIAYHGDTINTAARIQGMCNVLSSELLISDSLRVALGEELQYRTTHFGDISLKGKRGEIALYDVSNAVDVNFDLKGIY